jgi:hypothetical protein
LSPGCVPPDYQEELPPGANGQLDLEGDSSFILLASWGEGHRFTTEPSEVQEPVRRGEHCSSDW